MVYEFITPSDPITFVADNDKVAIAVGLFLGNGKAGVTDANGNSLPTMYMFHPEPLPLIEKDLGSPLGDFLEANKKAIADTFASFCYGSIANRAEYDKALSEITDEGKVREFKAKHEDESRSSMSRWVKSAWDYADTMYKNIEAEEA